MTTAVAVVVERPQEQPALLLPTEQTYVTETPTGLVFAADTPIEIWGPLTERLIRQHKRIEWAIGDALQFGERRYGDTYTAWVHETGLAENTLATIKWVAGKIESSRRREDVGWSHHREVAGLDSPEDQDRVLEEAADKGMTRLDLREKVKEVKQERKREKAHAAPAPEPEQIPSAVVCKVADARNMPLEDETVDLIVTSPPYGLEIGYEGGDVDPAEWSDFMLHWLVDAWRVTKWQGRLALNIPLDTSEPYPRPTYSQAIHAAEEAGWNYQATIVWHENNTTKGNRSLGSVNSAARPCPVDSSEMIVLLSKGEWGPSSKGKDDISPEEWQAAGRGPWTFSGESHAWELHPAPFPVELPRRLIKYLCRVGDTVLDPFAGSGTTLVAALECGRRAIGFDVSEKYVASALRRVVKRGVAA